MAAGAAALMVVALASSPALAQTGQSTGASNTPAQEPTTANAPAQAPAPAAETQDDDPTRMRFGGAIDFSVVASTTGAVALGGGLTLRLGAQFNHLWALYYQPHGIVAGWVEAGGQGSVFALFNVGMLELNLPFFQFGLGPSWDVSHIEGCNIALTDCTTTNGSNFGLDARVAVVLGSMGRGRRAAFSINVNVHSTFIADSGAIISTSISIGGEAF